MQNAEISGTIGLGGYHPVLRTPLRRGEFGSFQNCTSFPFKKPSYIYSDFGGEMHVLYAYIIIQLENKLKK